MQRIRVALPARAELLRARAPRVVVPRAAPRAAEPVQRFAHACATRAQEHHQSGSRFLSLLAAGFAGAASAVAARGSSASAEDAAPAAPSSAEPRMATCTLPDGRTLAYTDSGDADGVVVFAFHGMGSSHLTWFVFVYSRALPPPQHTRPHARTHDGTPGLLLVFFLTSAAGWGGV